MGWCWQSFSSLLGDDLALQLKAKEYQQLAAKKTPKPNKFGAVKTTVGDTTYDSRKEARYCEALKLRERAGQISNLELQPKFDLMVNGTKVGTYKADASYHDKGGKLHVIDVKGGNATKTQLYRLKAKLMLACHGIEIEEV